MTVEQSSTVHTRMFAPLIGIVEDPATGSASGALGAYLVQHGVVDIGPITTITAEQGYEIDRPSRILIQVDCGRGNYSIRDGRWTSDNGGGGDAHLLAG